jgi:hypothetical protein
LPPGMRGICEVARAGVWPLPVVTVKRTAVKRIALQKTTNLARRR